MNQPPDALRSRPGCAAPRERFHALANFRKPDVHCLREVIASAPSSGLGFASPMKKERFPDDPDQATD
ncbi:hypothetical protein THIX_50046 [Thiomonas sp. X19]|nr:hypothetical protein THIX_50003 [Thiomonas sp. X19]SCC93860.1 hypothetical protein THIX_50046 [Thiomonas sp. X19]